MTTLPKYERGRPTKYKPEYCDLVIEIMANGRSLNSFAAAVGISRATVNVWMGQYPDFLEAVGIAKSKAAEWWEEVGTDIARNGGGNSTLVVFGLKNLGQNDWVEKSESTVTIKPHEEILSGLK
jgi:hypothetical protein